MRQNRIRTALEAVGGTGTTWDIAQLTGVPPARISAQIAGMERRGDIHAWRRVRQVRDRGRYGLIPVEVTIWKLT